MARILPRPDTLISLSPIAACESQSAPVCKRAGCRLLPVHAQPARIFPQRKVELVLIGRHLNRQHSVTAELLTDLRTRACAMWAEHTPIHHIARRSV